MTLTNEQRNAVGLGEPVTIEIDGKPCVLILKDVYEKAHQILVFSFQKCSPARPFRTSTRFGAKIQPSNCISNSNDEGDIVIVDFEELQCVSTFIGLRKRGKIVMVQTARSRLRRHAVPHRVYRIATLSESNPMQAITLTRTLDSETLHLPELRPYFGHEVEITVRDAPVEAPDAAAVRQSSIEVLSDVWQRCREANWDGEGAKAVEQEAYQTARRLLESLPAAYSAPTISAEPDGHLNLEWYRQSRQLVTVSVSPDKTLYWAALVGSEDPRGSCQYSGEFPGTLLYWIERVCAE